MLSAFQSKRVNKLRKIHVSSSGNILCTSIIEITDIFNERLGSNLKFRLKMGGEEALIYRGSASSISREGRFLSYLSNRK